MSKSNSKLATIAAAIIPLLSQGLALATEGNIVVSRCTDEGTTYDKTKCKAANVGKVFGFSGSVFDVKTADTLTIKLDGGNFADVVFVTNVGDSMRKDDKVDFHGRLSAIGTGIVVNHNIVEATVDGSKAATSNTRYRALKPGDRGSDCQRMFQAFVFNNLLEEACGFKGGVATKIGNATKSTCGTPTDDQLASMTTPVLQAVRDEFAKLGTEGFCRQNRAGYEGLAKP